MHTNVESENICKGRFYKTCTYLQTNVDPSQKHRRQMEKNILSYMENINSLMYRIHNELIFWAITEI